MAMVRVQPLASSHWAQGRRLLQTVNLFMPRHMQEP